MLTPRRWVVLLALGHACVDGMCAFALFWQVKPVVSGTQFWWYVVLYNLLAFPLQAIIGLYADHAGGRWRGALAAPVLLAFPLVLLAPLPVPVRVTAIGVLNGIYHVVGGITAIRASRGRLGRLGLFTAPGAIGLAAGILLQGAGIVFAASSAVLGALLLSARAMPTADDERHAAATTPIEAFPPLAGLSALLLPVMVLLSVVCRGIGGGAALYPWKTGLLAPLLLATVIAAGKAAGGYASDRWGALPCAAVATLIAALLLPFGHVGPLPALLGQFFVNCTMPVTLFLLIRAWPQNPGMAFGMAAGALYVGTMAGFALKGALTTDTITPWLAALFVANVILLLGALLLERRSGKNSFVNHRLRTQS